MMRKIFISIIKLINKIIYVLIYVFQNKQMKLITDNHFILCRYQNLCHPCTEISAQKCPKSPTLLQSAGEINMVFGGWDTASHRPT